MAESSDYTVISFLVSHTAGTLPTTNDIEVPGEIALNTADRKIWSRGDNDNIVEMSGGNDHTHESADITDLTNIINEYVLTANRPTVTTTDVTSYTLTASDETSIIRFTAGTAVSVTVPQDSSLDLPIGYICHLHQTGAGTVTVAGEGSATINSSRSLVTGGQYAALSLFKLAANTWTLVGDQE